jgi:hypothetical protein
MKKFRTVVGFLAIMMGWLFTHADVVVRGDVDVRIKIVNASQYPDHKFYIEYRSFYYRYGWQEGDLSEVVVQEGDTVETGSRGASSYLYANAPDGKVLRSKERIGGQTHINDYDVSYVLREYRITGIKDSIIGLELLKSYFVYPNGRSKKATAKALGEPAKTELDTGSNSGAAADGDSESGNGTGAVVEVAEDHTEWAVFVVPMVCLAGLVVFFWMRRNPVRERTS